MQRRLSLRRPSASSHSTVQPVRLLSVVSGSAGASLASWSGSGVTPPVSDCGSGSGASDAACVLGAARIGADLGVFRTG